MVDIRLEITKVDKGWYTYVVYHDKILRMGQGDRKFVNEKVNTALTELRDRP